MVMGLKTVWMKWLWSKGVMELLSMLYYASDFSKCFK